MKFFCDTYALVEMIKGNKAYQGYIAEELHTSMLNLYELYFNLLREYGEETAFHYYSEFLFLVLPVLDEYIFLASKFKLRHAKENVSYADALGYAIAAREGMKFLTGDARFEHKENVEFVK